MANNKKKLVYKHKTDRFVSDPLDLVRDLVRARILYESILHGEISVDHIIKTTGKARSTISIHLKKLVEGEVLDIYMDPNGKTKFYRLNPNFQEKFKPLKDPISNEILSQDEKNKKLINNFRIMEIFLIINTNMFSEFIANLSSQNEKIIDENELKSLNYKDKKYLMPEQVTMIVNKEISEFIIEKNNEIFQELLTKFNVTPEFMMNLKEEKYIYNFQLFPFLSATNLNHEKK